MIARLAYWECGREHWGEDQRLFEGRAVPIMRGQPGFVEAKLLGEKDGIRRIAFTVWEGEAQYAEFLASDAFAEITEMFAPMYVDGSLPKGESYEVRAKG